jgi:signal transduction histidine kinase
MTDLRPATRPELRAAVPGRPLRALAVLLGLLVVIWASTGAGYFWPVWPAIGAWMIGGSILGVRTAARLPAGTPRGLYAQGAWAVCVGSGLVVIWAVTGLQYFWPIWPLMAFTALFVLRWSLSRGSRGDLEQRVQELSRTRRGALDSQADELRRIERDLHDGAQARLVALSMKLGRAEERFRGTAQGEEVSALLKEAREDASAAIRELRELARGIAPPVLADRGLEAAVRSLADRSGAEVTVSGGLERRPPAAVETAAYFVVAESLTNAAKHAPGARVEISLGAHGDDLFVEVTDFGPGGADPAGGGLTGLRRRVEALDGRLTVTSPASVGTQVEAVLPCGW